MKKIYPFIYVVLMSVAVKAQTTTWANNAACIFYTHCTTCHHDNGIAPFSLTTYAEAFAQRQSIYNDINGGIMPPFSANIHYQQYQNERYLSAEELSILNAWVSGGGASGDTSQAPAAPVYTTSVVITNPNLTGIIPTYTIPQLQSDLYRCFIVSNPSTSVKYISGIEVIPGNPTAVHHVLVFADTSQIPVTLDSADPGPGYTEFGNTGSNSSQLVGAWTPGSTPYFTPSGMGIKVEAGSRIILQIHYPAGSSGKVDSTRINIQYTPLVSGLRSVAIVPALAYYANMTNGPLAIAANAVDTFYEQYTVPAQVSLLSVAPHAHLICQYMETFAVTPAGDTIPLAKIDNWNFHWQGFYSFKKLIVLPAGSVLHGKAIYNNTTSNSNNPNSPPQQVNAGENTTDEMMLFYYSYTPYQSGDENVVYDTTTMIPTYNNCVYNVIPTTGISSVADLKCQLFPNPTSGNLELTVDGADECTAQLTDVTGKLIRTVILRAGFNSLDISAFESGIYFIRVTDNADKFKPQTLRVVKQ